MSAKLSPSNSEANHDDLVARGRRLLITFAVIVGALQVAYLMMGDPDRLKNDVLRVSLTMWLCIAICRGSNAARWITASLLIWPVFIGVAAIMTPNEGDKNRMLLHLSAIIVYGVYALVLVLNRNVSRYMDSMNPSRDS